MLFGVYLLRRRFRGYAGQISWARPAVIPELGTTMIQPL